MTPVQGWDEARWVGEDDPENLLDYIGSRISERLRERKARLFVVACAGRVERLRLPTEARGFVDLGERYADGDAGREELNAARANAARVVPDYRTGRAFDAVV